jgi:hypothetical protein
MHELPALYGKFFCFSSRIETLPVTGASDQLKPFDSRLWIQAMANESEPPTDFVPEEFEEWADDILYHNLNITRDDITAPIVRDIYCHLSNQVPLSISS